MEKLPTGSIIFHTKRAGISLTEFSAIVNRFSGCGINFTLKIDYFLRQFSVTSARVLYFSAAIRESSRVSSMPENASSESFFAVKTVSTGKRRFFISDNILPLWRVPIKSPPPRIFKSASAISKPSEQFFITESRSLASSESVPISKKQ